MSEVKHTPCERVITPLEALEEIARQPKTSEVQAEDYALCDWEGGYDACIDAARAAISKAKGDV